MINGASGARSYHQVSLTGKVPVQAVGRSVGLHSVAGPLLRFSYRHDDPLPAARRTGEAKVADTELRDRVERALDWEPEVTSIKIGVGAADGVVTLTGFLDTYAEKLAAERVAKRTFGVKAIANDLEIKPLFKKTDTEIAQSALNAFQWRVNVPDDKLKVTVKDGWVTLDGNVEWSYQKNAAESAVKYLQGVKGVANDIKVKPTVSTTDVKLKIEDALRRIAEVDARRIYVEAADGKVTL